MTPRVFWHNVAANLVSAGIGFVLLVLAYRFWRGHWPTIENLVG